MMIMLIFKETIFKYKYQEVIKNTMKTTTKIIQTNKFLVNTKKMEKD
jgi:hypothetical protein